VRRRGQTGSSPLGSILGLLFGGGAAMVVVALFMTGLAQRQIIPWARARAERAMERATSAVQPGTKASTAGTAPGNGSAARADSARGGAFPADSLQALSAQLETQKVFLAQRTAELGRMRAGIDSLREKSGTIDDLERKRQAKLFAAMKTDEAARVLGQMDDATLAMLLDAMNAKAAAKVLGKLDPGRVARLASRAVHRGELTGVDTPTGQEAGPAAR
jgi:flagellar motility protein MotE (MotC chaperone)